MSCEIGTKIEDTIEFYSDALIVQYKDKPKAIATIEALCKGFLIDGVLFQLPCLFNIDEMEGVNLDRIGKILGVDRYFQSSLQLSNNNYIGYVSSLDWSATTGLGYTTTTGFSSTTGIFLTTDNIQYTYSLTDVEYRILLYFTIARNYTTIYSIINIANILYQFFENAVSVIENTKQVNIYYIIDKDQINLNIINAIVQKKLLMKPMGVGLRVLVKNSTQKFFTWLSEKKSQYSSFESNWSSEVVNNNSIFMSENNFV